MFKKIKTLLLVLITIIALSATAFAAPPLGNQTEDYYTGLWNMKIIFKCFRQADGKPVNFSATSYAKATYDPTIVNSDGDYIGGYAFSFHPEVADNSETIGGLDLIFDYASENETSENETCIATGYGWHNHYDRKFIGTCDLEPYVILSNDANGKGNPKKSKLNGTHKATCYPAGGTPLQCSGKIIANWQEYIAD